MQSNYERKSELRIPPPPGHPKHPAPPWPAGAAVAASQSPTPATSHESPPRAVQDLSTVELVKEITAEVTQLARKEIELAKTELKANLKAEAIVVSGLSIAALAALCTINLLLVTVVLALATVLPGWAAGLIVTGITLAATGIIAWFAWSKRVRKPLERTQRTLRDDVQWTKERLA